MTAQMAQMAMMAAASSVPMRTADELAQMNVKDISPAEWFEGEVAFKAKELLAMSNERTRAGREVCALLPQEARAQDAPKTKVFKGVVASFETEPSTGRLIVHFRTEPTKLSPDGQESARTEHLSNPHGRILARRIRELTGHQVLVHLEMQPMANREGQTTRVIKFVEDRGAVQS